jgi:DNA-binding HxlR family transcriptional regulator
MFDPTVDSMKNFVNTANEEIAELAKAAAHNKRVLMLAALLDGRKSFLELKKATNLSKTALANHLTFLVDSRVIERIDRGSYEITKDGKELLFQAIKTYYQSELYQLKQRELLSSQYLGYRYLGDEMMKHVKKVTNVGIYQPHGLSYPAAISGVLQAVGEKWDVDDVTAFTGYGFLINLAKDFICPSGPTALEAWSTIQNATEKLGWKLGHYFELESFPSNQDYTQPLSEKDEKRARNFFEKVKEAINKYDHPVVIWGIPVPEYGVVNGYQDDYYLVSTFRTLLKQEETPIAYNKIQAPGCIELITLEKKTHSPTDKDYKESLARALEMAKGEGVPLNGYVAGIEAYNVLKKQLLETEEKKISAFAFAYIIDCYYCGRHSAFTYLKKLADKYKKEEFGKEIEKTAKTYEKISNTYKELQDHFPFSGKQDLSLENRQTCAKILEEIKELEKQAINDLEKCVENWK